MKTTSVSILLLGAPLLALAARPVYTLTNYTSGFEYDSGSAILAADVPGPYNGLNWGLDIGPFTYAAGFCVEVCPTTFPVYVQFNRTDSKGSARISTSYAGSKVVDFQLTKFDFGCLSETHSGYPIPANCTLTVSGYKTAHPAVGAKPDVDAVFRYYPNIQTAQNTGAPYANMLSAVLPSTFRGLKTVLFNATLVRGANKTYYEAAPIVRLDTFQYTTRNLTKA